MTKQKTIKLKHKVANIFPWGDVLIPIIPKKMKKNKLTNDELTFLSESNKIEREFSEIALEDAIKAWEYAKREFKKNKGKLSIAIILGIHKRLLQRLAPGYAGNIRRGAVMIGGRTMSQSYDELVVQLNDWIKNEFSKKTEKGTKEAHIIYERDIHNFFDGNGRTGRILMNLQRLELGLPILIIYDAKKQDYYKWFRGDKNE